MGLTWRKRESGQVPHGTEYKIIGNVAPDYAYLDEIVSSMLRQSVEGRPASIEVIKNELIGRKQELITHQRLSELKQRVIAVTDIDDPLVVDPPRIVKIDYKQGVLFLFFQHPLNAKWKQALNNMGSFTYTGGIGPEHFMVGGNYIRVSVIEDLVPQIIDNFKEWLPKANSVYAGMLQREKQETENVLRRKLQKEVEEQEQVKRILAKVKI